MTAFLSKTYDAPNPSELSVIRQGVEISQIKPYLDSEIDAMHKAVVNSVLAAVNGGSLSAEMALSKWMEYIAYHKLRLKFDQRIAVGASLGTKRNLDI